MSENYFINIPIFESTWYVASQDHQAPSIALSEVDVYHTCTKG